jgi:LysR family transcriptional regulator, low CO2-responsive transcriptional regulator
MNYTLNQLRVFHKIVETESVTRAAAELFMSQPAVSIQLKNFQDQFDLPLTEPNGRQIKITDFGFEIAQITAEALEQLTLLQYKTKEYKGVVRGKLRIASASTGKYVVPYFLTDFLSQHPGIDLQLDVTNKTQVIHALKAKQVDFAIISVLPKTLVVDEEILIANKLYMVNNGEQDMIHSPLIFREQGSATRKEMENHYQTKKKTQRNRIELTSNEAVKQALLAGIGSSILPLIGIKNELLNGSLQIQPQKGLPIITQWRAVWLKEKQLSPAAEAYLSFLKNNKQQILEKHFGWYLDYP